MKVRIDRALKFQFIILQ